MTTLELDSIELMQAKTEIELLLHLNEKDAGDENNIGTGSFVNVLSLLSHVHLVSHIASFE